MRNIVIELPKGHLSLLSILATKSRFENQVPSLMSAKNPVLTPIEHMAASRLISPLRCLHVNVLLEDKLLRCVDKTPKPLTVLKVGLSLQ